MGSSLSPPGPNAVHLCVDMQNLFTSRGPWPTPWMEKALPSAACRTFPRTNRVHPFHSAASASGVGGGANYKRWDNVTRDPLSPDVLELVPELREFVPPAGVIDRLGCGQQDSLPPSVRPSDGQRPFFAHLAGAEEQMRSIPSTNVSAAKLCWPKAAADFRPRWTRETNRGTMRVISQSVPLHLTRAALMALLRSSCARPFGSAGRYGLTFGSD
jgi:hypothetical protein